MNRRILVPCIYCQERPAEPGEHTLPAALGRFPVFGSSKRILCKATPKTGEKGCNELLTGFLYDRLFRRGALSLYRRHLPFGVGRSARRGSRSRGPGYEAPTVEIDGGLRVPVDVDQGGKGSIPVGLVLGRPDGSKEFWRLPEHVRDGAALRDALTRCGRLERRLVGIIADDAKRAFRIVAEAFPGLRLSDAPMGKVGGSITAEMNWLAGEDEARAVAAIALHMFLDLAPFSGSEPEFSLIRGVIRGRAKPWGAVSICGPDRPQPFSLTDEMPERRKHIMVLGPSADRDLVALVRLFANPETPTPWWRVVLRGGAAPASSKVCIALAYYPDKPRLVDGREFDGEVLALEAAGTHLALRRDALSLTRGLRPRPGTIKPEGNMHRG